MRLAWATDVHLDFVHREERRDFAAALGTAYPEAVVLTGDIATGPTVLDVLRDLHDDLGLPIWFVLGNHDFYRSSIADVRARARALTAEARGLAWLPAAGVVRLSDDTALIGVDGWGDARLGNPDTPVQLSDFYLIEELIDPTTRRSRLAALGDESAVTLAGLLAEALAWASHVIVATHVPPWREACWHEGRLSNDDWLPYFTCHATGEVLRAAMLAQPRARMTVLCGHTHGAGEADILPNLHVRTGAAEYGAPTVAGIL